MTSDFYHEKHEIHEKDGGRSAGEDSGDGEAHLNRFVYPPHLQDEAFKTVLAQENLLCAEWA